MPLAQSLSVKPIFFAIDNTVQCVRTCPLTSEEAQTAASGKGGTRREIKKPMDKLNVRTSESRRAPAAFPIKVAVEIFYGLPT